MLTAAEVVQMRQAVNRTMVDSATIYRGAETNSGGVIKREWQVLSVQPCRINTLGSPVSAGQGGGEKGYVASRVSQETTHVLTLPAETDIEEADRVEVRGTTYEVTAVRKRGAWEITRRAELKEAEPEVPGSGSGDVDQNGGH